MGECAIFARSNTKTMFAIVEIAGQQFKVEKGQEIFVNRQQGDEGDKLKFDQVLLTGDGDKVAVGTPTLKKTVSASIVEHVRGDKVVVFKKKRRKGYRKRNGFRHSFTKIKIDAIS